MTFFKKPLLYSAACLLFAYTGITQATPLTQYDVKWSQLPDMEQGTDYLSMHRSFGPIVADDFRSDGRPITGFHWWGSYFLDAGQIPNEGVDRTVSFEISFHTDCPVGDPTCGNGGPFPYSTPSNNPFYFSAIVDVEEDFFGTTAAGEDVYEYWLDLSGADGPDFLGGTWNEVAGEIYWVDFGWNAGQFGTNVSDRVWGWHESFRHNLGSAVTTRPGGPANPHIGPWNQLAGRDMAFEVLTVPEPATVLLMGLGLAGLGFARRRRLIG